MTRLSELVSASNTHQSRQNRAAELERLAATVEDNATRNPEITLSDLFDNNYPGAVYFSTGICKADRDRIVRAIRESIALLLPPVMKSVARHLRAEAQTKRAESEAAAHSVLAVLGADWNDTPKADEPKADA